ncbi:MULTISPECIES: rod-binding protein [unclassified Novosphingobium]|uniref:rod-binding protein n=1 Tax=Novosphingobium TaxID=165696 RepID=UPI00146B9924|nr:MULTISPECIES: rod-binding protein [unclassified Novosphingobium]NMN03017.1 flagellar protein FlgJ [Novosphingobium sp. SG919]NMN86996.1 flagellar protein FlgJ [Novosphingobium sp. SG916]
MTAQSLNSAAVSGTSAASAPIDRAALRKAAQGFEAMFLRQMLSTARNTDLGGDDLFGKKQDDTFTQMRDERFAEIAAQAGTLGLAARLESQLAQAAGQSAAATGPGANSGTSTGKGA